MPVVRQAEMADHAGCCALEASAFPPAEAASSESIRIRLDEFPEAFLVAELQGRIVGQVNCGATNKVDLADESFKQLVGHEADGRKLVIFSLAVLPEFRRQGIAGKLLSALHARAKAQGRESVLLLCKKDLVPFYSRHGYEDCGISSSTHGGATWHEMAWIIEQGA